MSVGYVRVTREPIFEERKIRKGKEKQKKPFTLISIDDAMTA